MTKKQYSHLRDNSYSLRHRTFPANLYCVDIDMVELNSNGDPVAVMELKRSDMNNAKEGTDPKNFLNVARKKMADKLGVPYFIVVYSYFSEKLGRIVGAEDGPDVAIDVATYTVVPRNKLAMKLTNEVMKNLSESEYVQFLIALRNN